MSRSESLGLFLLADVATGVFLTWRADMWIQWPVIFLIMYVQIKMAARL